MAENEPCGPRIIKSVKESVIAKADGVVFGPIVDRVFRAV